MSMSPDQARALVVDRAREYRAQKTRTVESRELLVEALKEAAQAGVPELRMCKDADLSRMSVRRWLGKSPRK